MKKFLLSEILTSSVVTVPPHTNISEVLEKMASLNISCVVAVNDERHPLGIFTERDVVHLLSDRREFGSLKMADVMSVPLFTSSADVDFREAFRMLQDRGFRHLVVVDELGCLLGIITEGDFLHHLEAGDLSEFKCANKIMSRNIVTIDVNDTLAGAISLMSKNRYSCVVVMREQSPYGILTERDVVKLAPRVADGSNMPIGSLVRTPLITIPPNMTLPDAIKHMGQHKIRHLVVTEDNKLLGLVTRHDLVKTLQGGYVNFLNETIQAQRQELFQLGQQRQLFKLHEAALAAADNTVAITDRHAVIQWANPAFSKLTGYTLEEAIGTHMRDIVKSGEQSTEFYKILWNTLLDGKVWHGEIVNKRKDGTHYHEEMTITPIRIENSEITHFITVKHDITARKAAEDEINNLAFYDTLTQLPNRRMLNDRLRQAVATSKRNSFYSALMFLDLDNFKPLNDTYGHNVGDLLLVEVAHRLAGCVREADTVARFGGDEFVLMLSGLDGDKAETAVQAGIVAEKIRTLLSEPYVLIVKHEGEADTTVEHRCAVSIGVEVFNGESSMEDILKCADIAMYQAKEAGRNQVQFYDAKV